MKITKYPEVKVLVEGVHKMGDDEKIKIWATTTLIRSNINVIVDPGAFVNKDKLIIALENEGLKPTDISAVILTHSHIDHASGAFLFPHARLYQRLISSKYPGQFQRIDEGYAKRFDVVNESIADGLKVFESVGHSIDHISILVDTEQGKIVVAGDALANEELANESNLPHVDFVYSVEEYVKSRKKILEIADFIIPGHGAMFKVKK